LISLFRTVLLYVVVIAALRLTGKRQLGELSPSELVVTILISDLAAVPMQDFSIPLLSGITPVITLVSLEVLLSACCMNHRSMRRLVSGNPCTIIHHGKLNQNMLRRMRLSVDDVLEELRISGVTDISQVRRAIVETNGRLSIQLNSKDRPATCSELKLHPPEEDVPLIIVCNGKLIPSNLQTLGKSAAWVEQQCANKGIKSISEVFLFTLDETGKQFIQKKERSS
ncbi:MAG: DUF421 domain-containing protein, partial [Butyricicoccaceae bacterium]